MKLGKSTREAYGETLVELGKENPNIVVLDADLSKSTYTRLFQKEFPDRFFNLGIQEANMVSIAAGLASCGKIPFVSSFACFVCCKAFDQLRISVALPHFNVKVVASHGGISVGEDGPSQQSVEDIALMSALPSFVVMVPGDETTTKLAVRAAADHKGPVYIRVSRPKSPLIYKTPPPFQIGKAIMITPGKDITIITNGLLISEALKACEELEKDGISVRILDMHTVKPLDKGTIIQAAQETRRILVAEEHLLSGGLGSKIAQLVTKEYPVPMEFIGLDDTYGESGKPEELFAKYELSAPHIIKKAKRLLKQK